MATPSAAEAAAGGGDSDDHGNDSGTADMDDDEMPGPLAPDLILLQATVARTHSFKPEYIVRLIQSISDDVPAKNARGEHPRHLEERLRNLRIWHIAVIPEDRNYRFDWFSNYDAVQWGIGDGNKWDVTFWKTRLPVQIMQQVRWA